MKFAFISPEIIEYCKVMVLKAFSSQEKIIRQTSCNVISLILFRGGINIWPDILEFLINQLETNDDSIIETSVQAISFIIEDSNRALEEPKYVEEINRMLPSL